MGCEGGGGDSHGREGCAQFEVMITCWPWLDWCDEDLPAVSANPGAGDDDKKARKKQTAAHRTHDTSSSAPSDGAGGADPTLLSNNENGFLSTSIWRWYLRDPCRASLELMAAQSLLVCALLLAFFLTDHWRSHALSLAFNFAVLWRCIVFRREHY